MGSLPPSLLPSMPPSLWHNKTNDVCFFSMHTICTKTSSQSTFCWPLPSTMPRTTKRVQPVQPAQPEKRKCDATATGNDRKRALQRVRVCRHVHRDARRQVGTAAAAKFVAASMYQTTKCCVGFAVYNAAQPDATDAEKRLAKTLLAKTKRLHTAMRVARDNYCTATMAAGSAAAATVSAAAAAAAAK